MRADRLISTLLLQIHRRLTARALADRLEISERTVLRDMDALTAAGVPVVADRGPGGGWRLVDGYQTTLTGLTAAEIQTLFFAQPPQLLAALGLGSAAEAARLKLQAALPPASQQQAERARRSILIDPRGWHRVSPDGFDIAAHWETSTVEFRERLPRYYATFLVAPSVMRWVRYRGWRLEEEREEGSRVRVHVRFDAEEEGLQFALSFGADVEVVAPAELRGKVVEAAREMVARYSARTRTKPALP